VTQRRRCSDGTRVDGESAGLLTDSGESGRRSSAADRVAQKHEAAHIGRRQHQVARGGGTVQEAFSSRSCSNTLFRSKTKVLGLEFNFLDLGFVLFDEVAGSGNNFLHPYTSWI
jgi:hypothetical protein